MCVIWLLSAIMSSEFSESLVLLAERPLAPLGARVHKSPSALLSCLSDWICAALVYRMARRYSEAIHTPNHFVEMLFLIEDKRFPTHIGVDPIAITRAVLFNLRGRSLQGASTITQQLFTIRGDRSVRRSRSLGYKLAQAFWAVGQSAVDSKESILRRYVDAVYWGRSYYGLDRAAEGYFGRSRRSLSAAQSFFLVERIATPNRVSAKRISNLLERHPIRTTFARNGTTIRELFRLYEEVYGNGGRMWHCQAK